MNKNTTSKVIQALDKFKKHYIDNQKKVGLGIDVVIDLHGIKIQKRIATNTIILTMFPDVIMNEPAPAKRGKDLKSVREIFKYLREKFPSISYEENISDSDYAKDIDLDCERDMCDVFDENLEKRQQSEQTLSNKKKKNPALFFEISKNTKFPIMFKFRCNEAFLFVLESHCHIDYITGFKKFKNEDITVKTNDGVIDHFDDYKMNVCLIFLLNKFCKKSYSVKPFKIDSALLNLMTIKIPDSEDDEEDQTKIGVKPIFLNVVYESFFEKYDFNYPTDKFVIEVLKNQARHATSRNSGTPVAIIRSPTQRMGDALNALRPQRLRTKAASSLLPHWLDGYSECNSCSSRVLLAHVESANCPVAYQGLKITTSLSSVSMIFSDGRFIIL